MRARISCCPMFGGCDLAMSGGLPSNMFVYSGVSCRVCMGCNMCCRGVKSRSGPSSAENVGRGEVGVSWWDWRRVSLWNTSLNNGARKSIG